MRHQKKVTATAATTQIMCIDRKELPAVRLLFLNFEEKKEITTTSVAFCLSIKSCVDFLFCNSFLIKMQTDDFFMVNL